MDTADCPILTAFFVDFRSRYTMALSFTVRY